MDSYDDTQSSTMVVERILRDLEKALSGLYLWMGE